MYRPYVDIKNGLGRRLCVLVIRGGSPRLDELSYLYCVHTDTDYVYYPVRTCVVLHLPIRARAKCVLCHSLVLPRCCQEKEPNMSSYSCWFYGLISIGDRSLTMERRYCIVFLLFPASTSTLIRWLSGSGSFPGINAYCLNSEAI